MRKQCIGSCQSELGRNLYSTFNDVLVAHSLWKELSNVFIIEPNLGGLSPLEIKAVLIYYPALDGLVALEFRRLLTARRT